MSLSGAVGADAKISIEISSASALRGHACGSVVRNFTSGPTPGCASKSGSSKRRWWKLWCADVLHGRCPDFASQRVAYRKFILRVAGLCRKDRIRHKTRSNRAVLGMTPHELVDTTIRYSQLCSVGPALVQQDQTRLLTRIMF